MKQIKWAASSFTLHLLPKWDIHYSKVMPTLGSYKREQKLNQIKRVFTASGDTTGTPATDGEQKQQNTMSLLDRLTDLLSCVVSGSIPGVLKRPRAKQRRPDEQVTASHGRSATVGVWVCLCAWVNAQYCKVLFGALCTKAQYKCSPCAIYHDPTSHSDYYISCTLTMLSALLGGTWTAGTCGGKCVHSTTRIGGGDLPSERRLSTQSPEILSRVGSAFDRRGFQGQKTSDFYNPQILPPGLFLEQYVSNCCRIFRSFIGSK